jgi:hypothetical protein
MSIITMRLRFILSIVFFCSILHAGHGQKMPRFKFGIDIAKLLSNTSVTGNSSDSSKLVRDNKFEINTGLRIDGNVWFILDVGFAKKQKQLYFRSYDYNSSGWYYKPGIEYAMPIKKNLMNVNFGYRFAISSFQETYTKTVRSAYWGTLYNESYTSPSQQLFIWHEISTGFRLSPFYKKYPLLTFGVSVKIRASVNRKKFTTEDAYFPGYGGQSKVVPAVNLETLIYF